MANTIRYEDKMVTVEPSKLKTAKQKEQFVKAVATLLYGKEEVAKYDAGGVY